MTATDSSPVGASAHWQCHRLEVSAVGWASDARRVPAQPCQLAGKVLDGAIDRVGGVDAPSPARRALKPYVPGASGHLLPKGQPFHATVAGKVALQLLQRDVVRQAEVSDPNGRWLHPKLCAQGGGSVGGWCFDAVTTATAIAHYLFDVDWLVQDCFCILCMRLDPSGWETGVRLESIIGDPQIWVSAAADEIKYLYCACARQQMVGANSSRLDSLSFGSPKYTVSGNSRVCVGPRAQAAR